MNEEQGKRRTERNVISTMYRIYHGTGFLADAATLLRGEILIPSECHFSLSRYIIILRSYLIKAFGEIGSF